MYMVQNTPAGPSEQPHPPANEKQYNWDLGRCTWCKTPQLGHQNSHTHLQMRNNTTEISADVHGTKHPSWAIRTATPTCKWETIQLRSRPMYMVQNTPTGPSEQPYPPTNERQSTSEISANIHSKKKHLIQSSQNIHIHLQLKLNKFEQLQW